MDALTYITTKFDLHDQVEAVVAGKGKLPIEIPNANRETLARLFYLLGYTSGAEIGVERAHYSEVLCQQNPGVRLLCVDAWKAYRGYRDHVRQDKLDRFYEEAGERLKPYPGAQRVRAFSVEAAKSVPDASLDFVYIDGNHNFENCTADLAAWSAKVRPGGIVAGHDYALHRWPNQIHVVQAVKGWTDAYQIKPWFVLGSTEKREGELRDDARSFFWVHEPRPVVAHGRPVRQ
jgi:hypothetical protein